MLYLLGHEMEKMQKYEMGRDAKIRFYGLKRRTL